MSCDTSVDMQSADASMMDISSMDISMKSLSIQDASDEDDKGGMDELTRRLGELKTSRTDEVVLESIEDKIRGLRALTNVIANDQAEMYMLQQALTDIHAVATDNVASTDSMMGSDGRADSDMTWLLTEWGTQSILATCIRDWSELALAWIDGVIRDLHIFDDKVVQSMNVLHGLRGDIQHSNNIFLQRRNSYDVGIGQVISTMQRLQLDEQPDLTLPKRPPFPQLDTGFPLGFLSYEQEEFNQRAKDVHTLGVNLANVHHT